MISAADGRTTIFDMLGGEYTSSSIRNYYDRFPTDPQPFAVHVSLGVARDLSREPPAIVYMTESPTRIAGMKRDHPYLKIYTGEGFAPPGKSVIQIPLASTYDYWAELHWDRGAYEEVKAGDAETCFHGSTIGPQSDQANMQGGWPLVQHCCQNVAHRLEQLNTPFAGDIQTPRPQ